MPSTPPSPTTISDPSTSNSHILIPPSVILHRSSSLGPDSPLTSPGFDPDYQTTTTSLENSSSARSRSQPLLGPFNPINTGGASSSSALNRNNSRGGGGGRGGHPSTSSLSSATSHSRNTSSTSTTGVLKSQLKKGDSSSVLGGIGGSDTTSSHARMDSSSTTGSGTGEKRRVQWVGLHEADDYRGKERERDRDGFSFNSNGVREREGGIGMAGTAAAATGRMGLNRGQGMRIDMPPPFSAPPSSVDPTALPSAASPPLPGLGAGHNRGNSGGGGNFINRYAPQHHSHLAISRMTWDSENEKSSMEMDGNETGNDEDDKIEKEKELGEKDFKEEKGSGIEDKRLVEGNPFSNAHAARITPSSDLMKKNHNKMSPQSLHPLDIPMTAITTSAPTGPGAKISPLGPGAGGKTMIDSHPSPTSSNSSISSSSSYISSSSSEESGNDDDDDEKKQKKHSRPRHRRHHRSHTKKNKAHHKNGNDPSPTIKPQSPPHRHPHHHHQPSVSDPVTPISRPVTPDPLNNIGGAGGGVSAVGMGGGGNTSSGGVTPVTPGSSRPGTPEKELGVDILMGETDGLPQPAHRPARTFTREASAISGVIRAKNRFLSSSQSYAASKAAQARKAKAIELATGFSIPPPKRNRDSDHRDRDNDKEDEGGEGEGGERTKYGGDEGDAEKGEGRGPGPDAVPNGVSAVGKNNIIPGDGRKKVSIASGTKTSGPAQRFRGGGINDGAPPPTGILSSLLKLYDSRAIKSAASSTTTLVGGNGNNRRGERGGEGEEGMRAPHSSAASGGQADRDRHRSDRRHRRRQQHHHHHHHHDEDGHGHEENDRERKDHRPPDHEEDDEVRRREKAATKAAKALATGTSASTSVGTTSPTSPMDFFHKSRHQRRQNQRSRSDEEKQRYLPSEPRSPDESHPLRPEHRRSRSSPNALHALDLAHNAYSSTREGARKLFSGLEEFADERGAWLTGMERPMAAKNKGGVIGALQAGAMGLGGAAAPKASTIAPDPAKPGYRLSRYKIDESKPPSTSVSAPVSRDQTPPRTPGGGLLGPKLPHTPTTDPTPGILTTPSHKINEAPDYFSHTPLVASPAQTPFERPGKYGEKRATSHIGISNLADTFNTKNYYAASSVLKAKRAGQANTASPSQPGTPAPEYDPERGQLSKKDLDQLKEKLQGSEVNRTQSRGTLGTIGTFMTTGTTSSLGSGSRTPKSGWMTPGGNNMLFRGGKNGKKKHKNKHKKAEEIFITLHVAAILQRQDFILKLARALMMFGAPSHRLEQQIQATAKVLELQCQVIYLYNFMLLSFQDEDAHVSEIRIIKQNSVLDLGKLRDLGLLHYEVCHDEIGVDEASAEISRLMSSKPKYGTRVSILVGGLCSVFISAISFNASFVDLLLSFPLGCGLVAAQCLVAAKSDVLSAIFEILIAGLASLIAAALASTGVFCYAAVVSSSIVLILPGWLVVCGAMELQSRSIVSGSVRLVWALIYSLFLGFGISIGAQFWLLFSNGNDVHNAADNSCKSSHVDNLWYRKTISLWFAFLFVPGYSFFLALRNQQPIFRKETLVTIVIAGCGWTANHFAAIGFPGRSDISSALGAGCVGFLGNIWGKGFQGTSFLVTVIPVMFQLPSGLGNGGLLNFAANTDSTNSFDSGFSVAQQLITVAIGMTVGLFVATVLVYPFGKRRGGLSAF